MPSLVQAILDEIEARDPLTAARIGLAKAEADLSGLVARITAGHVDIAPPGVSPADYAHGIIARVYALRHAVDELRLGCLPFETVNGSRPCPNCEADMVEAVRHAIDRLQLGIDDLAQYRDQSHPANVAASLRECRA